MAKRTHSTASIARQQQLEDISDGLEKPAARNYRKTWRDAGNDVDGDTLERAIETGPSRVADLMVPAGLTSTAAQAMVDSGVRTGLAVEESFMTPRLAAPANDILLITPVPPRAAAWAQTHALELIEEINEPARVAIRNLVVDGIADGQHVGGIAKTTRESIGIHPRNERAVRKQIEAMRANGVKESVVQSTAARRRKAAVRYRANVIARTETVEAMAHGRRALWDEMASKGHVNREQIEKEWMTAGDERVCPICGPLDGEVVVGLNTPFPGGFLSEPAHVGGCRCATLMSEVTR